MVITFRNVGSKTYYSCGCITDVIGKNFLVKPCSLDCEVYLYIMEQSIKQGNKISIQNEVKGK